MSNQQTEILSIDIGGTYTKYSMVDKDGKLIERKRFKTPNSYELLLAELNKLRSELQPENDTICISSPCNYYNGALRGSSFVEYLVDRDIIGDMKSQYQTNVLIENDGNCAILCENWVGNAKDSNSSLVLVIGSGIGGGVILDGKLLKGEQNLAGDLGYMLLGSEAKTNGTANCLGILGAARYNYSLMSEIQQISNLEQVFDDPNCDQKLIEIKQDMCRALAIGAINYKYIFDTKEILIGGEISKNQNFLDEIDSQIDLSLAQLSGYKYRPTIRPTRFNNDSNIIGAASLYFNPIEPIIMKLKIHYFLIAIYMSVFMYLVPLHYIEIGYSQFQVTILTSILSIGAIFQPLWGFIGENKIGIKTAYNRLSTVMTLALFGLYFFNQFAAVIILFAIYGICVQALTGFSDNIIMKFSITSEQNYGNFKVFCTIGWGIGVALCMPIIVHFSSQSMFIFLALISLIAIILINSSNQLTNQIEHINDIPKFNFKSLFVKPSLLYLLLFASLFNGILTVKSYYMTIILSNVTTNDGLISLFPIILMLPEIIILLLYPRINKLLNSYQIFQLSIILLLILLIGGAWIKQPIPLILVLSLHGVLSGLFLPTLLYSVHRLIQPNLQITTFLLINSMTFAIAALISLAIVAPLTLIVDISVTYYLFALIVLFTFIPLAKLKQYL